MLMSNAKANRYGSDTSHAISMSTVCRVIKQLSFYDEDNLSLINNNGINSVFKLKE